MKIKIIFIYFLALNLIFSLASESKLKDFLNNSGVGLVANDELLTKTKEKSALKNYTSYSDLQRLKKKLHSKSFYARAYGDSHLAADFFSSVLRNTLFKPNAVGFAQPLQPKYQQNLNLKYNSQDYEVFNSRINTGINYPLGGIIAKATKKGAKISLDVNLENKKFMVGFVFKSKLDTNSFSIKDSQNKSYELRARRGGEWFYKEYELSFPLQISALQKDAELGGYFIYNKKSNNLIIDTVAINGAKSDLWMSWNEKIIKEELKLFNNDLIIIGYGSNDALSSSFDKKVFKDNIRKLIKIARDINKNSTFMLISPPTVVQKKGSGYEISPNFKVVRDALVELAKDENTLLFDMHKFIQDTGGKDKWVSQKLSLRDVHLSVKGYELMAKKLAFDLERLMRLN